MSRPLPKSIYLVGPHSTGKSTLTQALLQHYGPETTPVLYEIARSVLKKKNYSADTISSNQCFQMQRDIFEAQFIAEKSLMDQETFFISDRNAVDPIVYTKMYSGNPDDWKLLCNTPKWKKLRTEYKNQDNSLVVLMLPYPEFLVDDGTRKMPKDLNEWTQFGNQFKVFLEDQSIPFRVLGENCSRIEDRVQKVVSWAEFEY